VRSGRPRQPLSTLISTEPSPTLEPIWTSTSLTVPATVDGTSIVALSDSSVAMASSTLMVSPTLTYSSMTGTSSKSPMSGTLTSTTPPPATGGDRSLSRREAAAAGAGAAACGAGAAVATPASTLISTTPSLTLEPSCTSTSLTTPSTVEGTSIVALSDSSVAIASSTLIVSPTLTNRSMTGTLVEIADVRDLDFNDLAHVVSPQTDIGLGLFGSSLYLTSAAATLSRLISPLSASAFSAPA
jgi:hypothetical protein